MIRYIYSAQKASLRSIRTIGLIGAAASAAGCINDDIELYEVRVRGRVAAASSTAITGTLHLQFHHQTSAGRGALAHPLGEIDRRQVAAATLPVDIDETLLYPTQAGQGLVVYGWLDRDGDGILCAPGQVDEPAGVVRAADFPSHSLTVDLSLTQPCAGAERLYP